MTPADLPDFERFFTALQGYSPFPWQVRAARLLAGRRTAAVGVPTGLGKSALIDAAVWAAAQGGWRRIAYVVDRRIVVDAVAERAARIRKLLLHATDPAMQALARRLGDIQVVRLRGGVHGDDDWVLHPDRLSIVLSTVDQIGSRLLLRGYGVTPRRWPLHAAFFASDTLVIVDEAHLSMPFLETLQALQRQGAGLDIMPMSATLADDAARTGTAPIRLEADDLALQEVRRRLNAVKHLRLVEADAADRAFVKVLIEQVRVLLARPGVRTLAVIVNRVGTARMCRDRLAQLGLDAALLTGRTRPARRDRQLETLLPALQAGRSRQPDEPVRIVVATQTIEVGADLDFDALVSESAPLSALRQRWGRLDRLGLRGSSEACVVHRTGSRADPVYGEATSRAWAWLRQQATRGGTDTPLDAGLAAFEQRLRESPAPAEPTVHAATLLPVHLELLAQTGHATVEPALGAWLHGPSDRVADVRLIWRDDLLPEGVDEAWCAAVRLLPPMLRESLPMPVTVVRRWLTGAAVPDIGDLDAQADEDRPATAQERPTGRVLRWRGAEACEVIEAAAIRPGDTLVLPAAAGGCDSAGWAPDSTDQVEDLADLVLQDDPCRPVVARLVDGHWSAWGEQAPVLREAVRQLDRCERDLVEADGRTDPQALAEAVAAAREALVQQVEDSAHPLLVRLRGLPLGFERHPGGIVLRAARTVEEVDGSIEIGRTVTLDEHHADVARWARQLLERSPGLDLPPGGGQAVVDAAAVHDAGKAEPRMQVLLHGSVLRAGLGPLLAKSGPRRQADQISAWRRSRLPQGFRHEFASLHFASPADDALTRHLIATHHGHARPWGPVCADPQAPGAALATLASHWADQWARLQRMHGPWGLARMEWLVRCADARASIEEAATPPLGAPADGEKT